jgi:organic hydroperoxide reductase OsmC/OhrA
MSRFPMHYTSRITRTAARRAQVEAAPRPVLDGGPPPEFGGIDTTWSPEHLLISSLGLCLFTTFEAYAAKDQLEVRDWRSEIAATVEKTAKGLAFTSFRIGLDLEVADADAERARALVERAKRGCMVSNALAVPVELDLRINVPASSAA